MTRSVESQVAAALSGIRNPRLGSDVMSAGMVQNLAVTDGRVSLTFVLTRDDPAALVREVRRALKDLPGVSDVKIDLVEPKAPPAPQGTQPAAGMHGPLTPGPEQLGHILAISSGKGGVGKSTIAANLAAELARKGRRVGVMDADVYGPNIPRMFGVNEKPPVRGNKIVPLERYGVKLISLGFLVERDAPAIWRGPIVTKITTPQEVAIGDALRGAKMFDRVGVPVIGIVENMSYFECPHCGTRTHVFLADGGKRLADELGAPLLGNVPLQARMADLADEGKPIVLAEPDSPAARALAHITSEVEAKVGGKKVRLPILTG